MAKLNHVGIYVSDLSTSISFYQGLFGFSIVNEFTSGEAKIKMLDLGGGMLELVQRPGSPGAPPAGNWSHLAISEPEFDSVLKKLEEKSIATRLVTMDNGNRLCFFNDPDGHVIEIMDSGI
jgi:catechol 2,3-dioxygenase-like lactoylglutathione lyase family enzyme